MTQEAVNEYRLGILEGQMKGVDEKLEKILTNHLPHLDNKMIGLSVQVKVLGAINIVGILAVLAISKLV